MVASIPTELAIQRRCVHGKTRLPAPVLTGDPGRFANPLTYARQFDEAGHQVVVYFDGAATEWFDGIEDHPEPAVRAYEDAKEPDLIAGVCDHCATFKGVADAVETEGFEIQGTEHAPDVAGLVDDGYEIHIV